jgi:O-antigen/teichoic acid export membrane protein
LTEPPNSRSKDRSDINSMRIWAGEAFWVGFGLITAVFALLAGTRFLTHLLSPAEYGRLALAVSLSTLAVQVFGEPIGKTAVRFYAQWCQAGKPAGFLQRLVKSLSGAAGCIALISSAAVLAGVYIKGVPGGYFVLMTGIFAILLVFNRVGLALEDAARKRRFRGIVQGGFEVMRFVFAVGLIVFFALHDAETVLTGFVLAGVLIVIAHGLFLSLALTPDPGKDAGKTHTAAVMNMDAMRAFQTPLIVSNACIWLVMMAERWALQYYGDPGDVGGYAAVYQLAFIPMLFVSNFLILLIEPILYQMIEQKDKTASSSQARRINNYAAFGIICFSLVLFLVLLIFYPMVGNLLLGAQFRSYSWLFPWLLLAGGCFAATMQLLLKLSLDLRTDLLAVLWAAVAVVAVVGYMIGACFWQLKGILTAVVAVNVLLFIFSLFFVSTGKLTRFFSPCSK